MSRLAIHSETIIYRPVIGRWHLASQISPSSKSHSLNCSISVTCKLLHNHISESSKGKMEIKEKQFNHFVQNWIFANSRMKLRFVLVSYATFKNKSLLSFIHVHCILASYKISGWFQLISIGNSYYDIYIKIPIMIYTLKIWL